jgi:hypothetical protein
MAPTEMAQFHPPMSLRPTNTPPESPNLSPIVTLTDEQAMEMEKAIAAMKMIPTTPFSHCNCYQYLPENSALSLATADSATPHQTCSTILNSQIAVEFAKQIVEALKSSKDGKELPPPPHVEQPTTEQPKSRASTLEFKKVSEV